MERSELLTRKAFTVLEKNSPWLSHGQHLCLPAQPFTVTLGGFSVPSKPRFPHISNGDTVSLLKCLAQCLTYLSS